MDIQLVAIDLDGTLLDEKNKIAKETKELIEQLKANGIKVVIATGRTFTAAKKYYHELGLDTPLISCNGGYIINPQDHSIIEGHAIDRSTLADVFNILDTEDVFYQFYTAEKIYAKEIKYLLEEWTEENKYLDDYDKIDIEILDSPIDYLNNHKDSIYKILVIEENLKLWETLWHAIEKHDDLELVSSFAGAIDIMHTGITKGHALENVCDYLNIDIDKTFAIGDNNNDATMLDVAKIGVAMENATDLAKEHADDITDSNENLGVYKAIKKYITLK